MTRRQFVSTTALAASAAPLLPTRTELTQLRRKLEAVLLENILPFWLSKTIDPSGGYNLNHSIDSSSKGPGPKMIVTQARMVWFFARMARAGYQSKRLLEASEHGYKFLREKMWDPRSGGFFWQLDASGKVTHANKHLYGQSFGLYALSEYSTASRRKDALDFTVKFFDLLEKNSHDKVHGGYGEYFLPDWSMAAINEQNYMGGAGTGMKLMNTHLHLMEALTAFVDASSHSLGRARLIELISIESSAVVRKPHIACTDKYDRDWRPRLEGTFSRVSYGHDVENVWLLRQALKTAGLPISPYVDFFIANWNYCRRNGFDETGGGFYDSGPLGEPADKKDKVWWVEAEALVSALEMYQLTSDTDYFDAFRKTWHQVDKQLIDYSNGEWYSSITPDGKPAGDKANIWKAAYHNGRAMLECIARLKQIEEKTA